MTVIITEKEAGMTVKDYLFKMMRLSVAAVKRMKYREEGITVNGESVTVRYCLKLGDILKLAAEDTEQDENEYTLPINISIKIAYEDEWLTVVDKPPMMPAHPSLGHREDTVANALAYRYRGAPYVFRPVNRLDRDTSGLMLVARGKISAGRLYKSMVNKEIRKSYIAILEGKLSDNGYIETYMCRECDSIIKRCVCEKSREGAKIAQTMYEVLSSNDTFSVVRAYPITGRTHQLRVHFAHLGHPIFGDTLYGKPSEYIDRHALHSAYLAFPHPESGTKAELFSPIPYDMKKLMENLSRH